MKARVLPFIMIRMFSFYFLYIGIVTFDELLLRVFSLDSDIAWKVLLSGGLIAIVPLGFAVVFWKKAEWLSGKVMAGSFAAEEINATLSFEEIQYTGFAIVGMFLVATAVPLILRDVTNVILLLSASKGALAVAQAFSHLAINIVQFVLGGWLVIGAKGIGQIVKKLRHG